MKLNITITDYVDNGTCDFTGSTGECIVLRNGDEPDMTILAREMLKFLRFEKRKLEKRETGPKPPKIASAS